MSGSHIAGVLDIRHHSHVERLETGCVEVFGHIQQHNEKRDVAASEMKIVKLFADRNLIFVLCLCRTLYPRWEQLAG